MSPFPPVKLTATINLDGKAAAVWRSKLRSRIRIENGTTALEGLGNQDDKTVGDRIVLAMDTPDDVAWREQCRHQLERDVMTRIKYGFCHVHKPVLDDAPVRTFATMAEYRRWCDSALPAYLGYRLASHGR